MISLYSEPYNATGSIDARAARRALGTTRMSFWDLFLREVLQNSWDARLHPEGGITFAVDAFDLTSDQVQVLRDQVFTELPAKGLPLGDCLKVAPVSLLVVTDGGTRGLGGPMRADRTPSPGERTDFVDFARNIGRAASKGIGGGTYGFGKGVLFDASKARTIIAYSQTTAWGRSTSRLIGMALGEDYDAPPLRYTGRHWWGIEKPEVGVSPLEGRQADAIASALGFGGRLSNGQTGTAIAVVCPEELDEPGQPSIVGQIANAVVRWAWPHMISVADGPTIRFELSENGANVELPDLTRHPRLRHYVDAYIRAQDSFGVESPTDEWPWTQKLVGAQQPTRTLGALTYRRLINQANNASGNGSDLALSGIALMRDPRFVVKYMPVSRGSQEQDVAGVFIADPSLDEEFARSEPVAHDDWLPARLQLAKYQRNPVKQALDKLRAEFQAWRNVGPVNGLAEKDFSVTRISALFGALLEGVSGEDAAAPSSAGPQAREQGRPDSVGSQATAGSDQVREGGSVRSGGGELGDSPARSTRRASAGGHARIIGSPALRLEDGHILARFDVIAKVGKQTMIIEAVPRVVLDSGSAEIAEEAPYGADLPQIAGWSEPAVRRYLSSASISVAGEGEHRLQVDVRQPGDTMIGLTLRTRPAE